MNRKILSVCFLGFFFFPLVIANAVTTTPLSGAAIKSAPTASDVVLGTDTTTGQTRNFQLGKLSAVLDWSAWPNGSAFASNAMVAYQGQIYKCLQPYTKNSGDTPAAFTAYWSVTGGGVTSYAALTDKPTIPASLADLSADSSHRVVTDAEKTTWNGKESALGAPATSDWCLKSNTSGVRSWGACGTFDTAGSYSPTGTWDFTSATLTGVPKTSDFVTFSASPPLSFNSSTGALSMVSNAYQAYDANMIAWPSAVSATEISYLDGATSNLQTQINAISTGGFAPTYVTTSPTAASTSGTYINTTNGHFYIVNSSGMLDIAGMWTETPPAEIPLLNENFETGAAPTGWAYTGLTVFNHDPAIEGIYDMIVPPGSTASSPSISPAGPVAIDFILNQDGLPSTGSNTVFCLLNSSGSVIGSVSIAYNGRVYLLHGATSILSGGSVSSGTAYHYYVEYTPSSGANDGLMVLYWTPYTGSETKPASPSVTVSAGTSTDVVQNLSFRQTNSPLTGGVYDMIKVSNL